MCAFCEHEGHLTAPFLLPGSPISLDEGGLVDLQLRASLVSLVKHDRISLIARDLREKRDWPEVLSVSVSPGLLTIYEERTT
jgi:hypothetical protein